MAPKIKEGTRYIAFKASAEMHRSLCALAAQLSMSVSSVIRLMIDDALDRKITAAKISGK